MKPETFDYKQPTPEQIVLMNKGREAFKQLFAVLSEVCPQGRYFSLVGTKLEEAAMFANKAIVEPK